MLSSGYDEPIIQWNTATGRMTKLLPAGRIVCAVPDSNLVLINDDRGLIIRDIVSGRLLRRFGDYAEAVAVTSDGRLVAYSQDGVNHQPRIVVSEPLSNACMLDFQLPDVNLVDLALCQQRRELTVCYYARGEDRKLYHEVLIIAFDGREIGRVRTTADVTRIFVRPSTNAVCLTDGKCVWDARSLAVIMFAPENKGYGHLDYEAIQYSSHTDEIMLGDTQGRASAWSVATGSLDLTLGAHDGWVRSVVQLKNLATVATSGDDHMIRIWDRSARSSVKEFGRPKVSFHSVSFQSDSVVACTALRGDYWCVDLQSGGVLRSGNSLNHWRGPINIDGQERSPHFCILTRTETDPISGESREVRTEVNRLDSVLNLTDDCISHLNAMQGLGAMSANLCFEVKVSKLGRRAVVREGRRFAIYNLPAGQLIQKLSLGVNNCNTQIALSNDDTYMAVRVDDSIVAVSLDSGEVIWTIDKPDNLGQMAFAKNEPILVSVNDWTGECSVVNTELRFIRRMARLPYECGAIAVPPYGTSLASGDAYHPWLSTFDINTGKRNGQFKGHEAGIRGLDFSAVGQRLASVANDGLMKLWDVGSQRLIVTFAPLPEGNWITYTPDGYYIGSGGAEEYFVWTDGRKIVKSGVYAGERRSPERVAAALAWGAGSS